jgi:hypothetical protein
MNSKTQDAMAAAQAAPADPMERYKIRSKANTPTRLNLFDPRTREETSDWLEVVSGLSDRFRDARDDAMQKAAVIAGNPNEAERKLQSKESQLEMYAALIVGWSFNVPCTKENVIAFLREAPQVQNRIIDVADESERFFGTA